MMMPLPHSPDRRPPGPEHAHGVFDLVNSAFLDLTPALVSLAKLRSIPSDYIVPPPGLPAATASLIEQEVVRQLDRRPNHVLVGITFQPNRLTAAGDNELSDAREERWLDQFSRDMDSLHLGFGPGYRRKKMARPFYVLVGQPGVGGQHYHGLVGVPADKLGAFLQVAPQVWKQITRGGSMRLDYNDAQPNAGWTSYAVRHLVNPQAVTWHVIPQREAQTLAA